MSAIQGQNDEVYRDSYGDLKAFKNSLGHLLTTAFKQQSQGSFAGSGQLNDAPNPGLSIDGLGPIGLPLNAHEAERVISQSEQAPFGRRDQTVVDLSVRRTWQIDASKVHFRNAAWAAYVQTQVLAKVGVELGISSQLMQANLYKLLLYGEGCHFEKHQDTEKEPRMFGTLVIVLPSPFTGGQVTVSHLSKEVTFDTAPHSEFTTCFTCLYTDVFHKVHTVTSGYRLALAYNLTTRAPSNPLPRAPVASGPMLQVRDMFAAWLARMDDGLPVPDFLAHFLDHQYSMVGLNFDNVKGQDRVKVAYLRDIAQELGFSIYLAQFDITVKGYGEGTGGGGYRRRRKYYDSYSDDGGSDDTMAEETERECELETGVAHDGSEISLSSFNLDGNDTLPPYNLNNWTYDDKEAEGYMGNWGGDVTHYYHKTVVLMWPQSRDFEMSIRTGGVENAVGDLEELLQNYDEEDVDEDPDDPSDDRMEIERLVRALPVEEATVPALAAAGVALKDISVFQKVAKFSFAINATSWVDAVGAFGFAVVQEALNKVIASYTPSDASTKHLCEVLDQLRMSFAQDAAITSWSAEQIAILLTKLQTLDDASIRYVVDHAARIGFARSRALLDSLLAKLKAKPPVPAYQYGNRNTATPASTTMNITIKLFEVFAGDEEGSAWCKSQLLPFLGATQSLTAQEVSCFTRLVELCLDNRPVFVPELLGQLRRSTYTSAYLTTAIQPIAAALHDVLSKRSLTLMTAPFDDFTTRFIRAGLKIFCPPEPALPGNYALPAVGNPQLDSFLRSPIQHVLQIRQAQHIRTQYENILARLAQQNRVMLTTVRNGSPHTLVIRKCHPTPRPIVPLRDSLTPAFQQEWNAAVRGCEYGCAVCVAMRKCMECLQTERTGESYLRAFGPETVKAFHQRLASTSGHAPSQAHDAQPASGGAGPSAAATSAPKRKASDVIDLTDDSPVKKTKPRVSV